MNPLASTEGAEKRTRAATLTTVDDIGDFATMNFGDTCDFAELATLETLRHLRLGDGGDGCDGRDDGDGKEVVVFRRSRRVQTIGAGEEGGEGWGWKEWRT